MYRHDTRSAATYGADVASQGWQQLADYSDYPATKELSRRMVEQDAEDRISGPKRYSDQERVGANYPSVSNQPFSDANFLSPESIAERFHRGSRDTQKQLLDLIRYMYDPTIPFFISANNNENTTTQMQNINQTFNALIMPNGTPRSRAFVVRPIWDVTPIQSLASVTRDATFVYDGSTTATITASRINPPLAFNSSFFPTLTVVSDFFVPEVSVELKVSPQMDINFTRGRLNSFQFMVIGNQLSVNTSVLGGQLSYGIIPDIRDCMDLEPTKLQSMSVSDKDAANNVFLSDGVAIIQGPTFAKLDPVNMRRVGGDGYSAVSLNVLAPSQVVPFKQTAYQEAASSPFPLPMPNQGTAYAPNSLVSSAAGNQFVYTGCIWLHNQVRFSLGTDVTTVQNIQIPNIGYDNNPEFTVTYRLPVSTGNGVFDVTTALNAEMLAPAQPYSIIAKHFYMQAKGTDTVVEWVGDKYDCPLTVGVSNEGMVFVPTMWPTNAGPTTAGPNAAGFLGATATSTYTFTVPRRENWQWIGTMIQGVDGTIYPVASGANYPGYPGTVVPVGATIQPVSTWTPAVYSNIPFFRARQPGPGVWGASGNWTAYPWFAIGDQSRLNDFRPAITAIAVNVPRLYDEGNLGPYRVVRIDNVSTGQTFTINGALQTEVVTTGSTAQFKKSDNAAVITDDNVIGFAQMLFSAKGIDFKTMYRAPDFAKFRALVNSLKNPSDLLRLPFWEDPRVNMRAATIGLIDSKASSAGPFANLEQLSRLVIKEVLPQLSDTTMSMVNEAVDTIQTLVKEKGAKALDTIGDVGSRALTQISRAADAVSESVRSNNAASSGASFSARRKAIKSSRCEELSDKDDSASAGMFGADGDYDDDASCAGMFGADSAGMFGADSAGMFGADGSVKAAAAFYKLQSGKVRVRRGTNPGLVPGQMISQAALIAKITRIRQFVTIYAPQLAKSLPEVPVHKVSLVRMGIVSQDALEQSQEKRGWNYTIPFLNHKQVQAFIKAVSELPPFTLKNGTVVNFGANLGDFRVVPIITQQNLSDYYEALLRKGYDVNKASIAKAERDIAGLGATAVVKVGETAADGTGVASFRGLSRFIWFGFVGIRSARLFSLTQLEEEGNMKYSFITKFKPLSDTDYAKAMQKVRRSNPDFLRNPEDYKPITEQEWLSVFGDAEKPTLDDTTPSAAAAAAPTGVAAFKIEEEDTLPSTKGRAIEPAGLSKKQGEQFQRFARAFASTDPARNVRALLNSEKLSPTVADALIKAGYSPDALTQRK